MSGSPTAPGSKLEKVGICIYLEDSADDDDTMKRSPQDENGGGAYSGMTGGMTRSYTAASSSDAPPPHLPVVQSNSTAAVAGRTFVPLSRVPSAPGSLK